MNRTSSFGPGFHAPAHAAPDDAVNRSIVAALLKVLARREPGLQRSITVTLHRIFFLCAAGSLRCAEVPFELAPEHSAPDMNTVRAALIDAQQDPNVSTQAQQLIDLFSKEHL